MTVTVHYAVLESPGFAVTQLEDTNPSLKKKPYVPWICCSSKMKSRGKENMNLKDFRTRNSILKRRGLVGGVFQYCI